MRKLKPTEMKVLKAIPEDLVYPATKYRKELVLPKQIHPYDLPKNIGFNYKTILNLYRMGLIHHGFYFEEVDGDLNVVGCSHGRCFSPYSCPIQLTNKSRKLLGRKEID